VPILNGDTAMTRTPIDRRTFLTTTMAATAAAAIASPAVHAQTAGPRVIVVGGGFGGAACARALRKADPRLTVTLIERNRTYTASPMSNSVIAGLRGLTEQQFGYDALERSGIDFFVGFPLKIDPQRREVAFIAGSADALTVRYDRLVLSPGIDFRWGAIQGYDPVAFFKEGKPVAGKKELTFNWSGASWYFSTQENLDAFKSNPTYYAPQFGGWCAYGTAAGHKSPTQAETWSIVDNKLYFNYNMAVQKLWNKNQKGLIEQANKNWPAVKKE